MMEHRPERPWRDSENVELFANIIRVSNINPDELFRFIVDQQIGPRWEQTPLPYDRTMSECRRQFDEFSRRNQYQPRPSWAGVPTSQYPVSTPVPYTASISRRVFDPQTSGGRMLLPKTAPSTPSEAGPAYPQSPNVAEAPATRKRGRPPKEEVSRRRAEAAERGEPYPPPRTKRPKRPSGAQGSPAPLAPTPSTVAPPMMTVSTPTGVPPAETGSESSGSKRRRQRPADIETAGPRTQTSSYESPPQTTLSFPQPSASTTSGREDTEVRMEGIEESAPQRGPHSYHDIVGIGRSSES